MGLPVPQILPDVYFPFGTSSVPLGLTHLSSLYSRGIDRGGCGEGIEVKFHFYPKSPSEISFFKKGGNESNWLLEFHYVADCFSL